MTPEFSMIYVIINTKRNPDDSLITLKSFITIKSICNMSSKYKIPKAYVLYTLYAFSSFT